MAKSRRPAARKGGNKGKAGKASEFGKERGTREHVTRGDYHGSTARRLVEKLEREDRIVAPGALGGMPDPVEEIRTATSASASAQSGPAITHGVAKYHKTGVPQELVAHDPSLLRGKLLTPQPDMDIVERMLGRNQMQTHYEDAIGGPILPRHGTTFHRTGDKRAPGEAVVTAEARKLAEKYVLSSDIAKPFSEALRALYYIRDVVRTPGFSFGVPRWVAEELKDYENYHHTQPTASIDEAVPYYVSEDVMEIVGSALPRGAVPYWKMRLDGLPTKYGWLWFADAPLSVFSKAGMERLGQVGGMHPRYETDPLLQQRLDMVALSWSLAYIQIEAVIDGNPKIGYRVTPAAGYSPVYDVRSWWQRGDRWDMPPIPMVSAFCGIAGTDFYNELKTLPKPEGYSDDAEEHGWLAVVGSRKMVHPTQQLFEILQTFMAQTMFVRAERNIDRAERRRMGLPKFTLPPPVHVVTLRKIEYINKHESDDDGPKREYSCHWPVEGHWHHFWYGPRKEPEKMDRRSIWVAGYLKGPRDKPFRGHGEKLFNVAR